MTMQISLQPPARSISVPPTRPHLPTPIAGATEGCFAISLGETDYRATHHVSSTGLKKMLRSPGHFQAYRRNPGADTAARRFGRAAHAWLLERRVFGEKFAVWDGTRTTADYRRFEAQNPGKTILNKSEWTRVQESVDALLQNTDFPLGLFIHGVKDGAGGVLEPAAETEFSIFWTDEETGVPCKVRLDAVRLADPMLAFDLKTTDDARKPAFSRQINQLHYDLQAAFYVEGLRRFTGKTCPFMIAALEDQDPYGSIFYALEEGGMMMDNGREKMRHALRTYARCSREGKWPVYQGMGVQEAELLPWMAYEPQGNARLAA